MATTTLLDTGDRPALEDGFCESLTGRRAVFVTWPGERRVGTITGWTDDGLRHNTYGSYAVVTFDDGQWARLDTVIELVDE